MLEGYGITECAPVVTLTRPNSAREGVGLPLPGVELCIIHSETLEKEPLGSDGEICICGPNVFSGYLGNLASPFIEMDGKRWYRSGDRGHLTPSGSLVLTGRLKRFIKIGAEMVSLSAIEEELLHAAEQKGWVSKQEGPLLAVVSKESSTEKSQIIVFVTFQVTKETLNEALHEHGFGKIIKVSEVKEIKQIPIMGTGKINYRALQETL
jgi:long-chain-fatty-acid--[acyl-carrier-protein] ligase